MRPRLPGSCFLALVVAWGAATAHELGAMKVEAQFSRDGRYRIDVVVDPEHVAGGRGLDTASAGAVATFRESVVAGARVAFDGVATEMHEVDLADAEAAALCGIRPGESSRKLAFRFAGELPRGVRSFTWSHDSALGSYLVGALNEGDAQISWQWVEGARESEPFGLEHAPPPLTRAQVVRLYLELGFTHILPRGLDHILFVLGLFLLSLRVKPILTQVTAFTLAHTITLGLSMYGIVSLSPRVVESLIALSIFYVAVENLLLTDVRPWRVAIVFGFGLLHGMGFAGVLKGLGLPRSEFVTALVAFNVGVEGGQLTVIVLAFLAVGLWFGRRPWYRASVTAPTSALIALVGLYWTIQRAFF